MYYTDENIKFIRYPQYISIIKSLKRTISSIKIRKEERFVCIERIARDLYFNHIPPFRVDGIYKHLENEKLIITKLGQLLDNLSYLVIRKKDIDSVDDDSIIENNGKKYLLLYQNVYLDLSKLDNPIIEAHIRFRTPSTNQLLEILNLSTFKNTIQLIHESNIESKIKVLEKYISTSDGMFLNNRVYEELLNINDLIKKQFSHVHRAYLESICNKSHIKTLSGKSYCIKYTDTIKGIAIFED